MTAPQTGTLYWLGKLLHDPDLDPTEKLLMIGLADHVGDSDVCFVGIDRLAEIAGVSYPTARRRLKDLEDRGRITRSRFRKDDGNLGVYTYTLQRSPAINLIAGQRSPGRSLVSDHVRDRTEVPRGEVPRGEDALFDAFWEAFPLKKGKDAARKAWAKAIKRGDPHAIVDGARAYRDDPERDPKYTKYPQGWLNDGRWEDDLVQARRRNKNVVIMEQVRLRNGSRTGDGTTGGLWSGLAQDGDDGRNGPALGSGPG